MIQIIKKAPVVCNLNEVYGFNRNTDASNRLLKFLNTSIWDRYLTNFTMKITSREQAQYFNKYVAITLEQAKDILLSTIKQNSSTWFDERSRRITGFVCYALYT